MSITETEIAAPTTTDNNITTIQVLSPNWFSSPAQEHTYEIRRFVFRIQEVAELAFDTLSDENERYLLAGHINTIADDLAAFGRMLENEARDLEQ